MSRLLQESAPLIQGEKKYLLEHSWFKARQLEELPSLLPYYLQGTRKLNNEYSFIILHLMAEFGKRKYKIPWRYKILNKDYPIPKKLDSVKTRIYAYAFENKPKLKYYTKSEIEAQRKKVWQNNQEIDAFNTLVGEHLMLVDLRNNYLHHSANMDGVGMEPQKDKLGYINRKRTIISG